MDTKHIHCMLEDMAEYGKCMIESAVGEGNVNLDDAGKIIDIVKDLAEAEHHALEAKCLRKEFEEDEAEEKYMLKRFKEEYGEEDGERRYYDDYRYKRSGRYAPKGKGSYMPRRGYEEPPYYHMTPEMYREHDPEWYRDMDRRDGKMYFTEPRTGVNTANSNRTEMSSMRDGREGRSGMSRRSYMETKEMHRANTAEDKSAKMKELEKYMQELSTDITEMIGDASPEERTLLKNKMQVLVQKL